MAAAHPALLARRLLRRDRFAAAIGVSLAEVREGYARATLRLRPDHLNGVGVVQGGAVFTLADFAFAAASNSHGTVAVGLDTSMTFVRGTTDGVLVAEALEESVSRRVSLCSVKVTDGSGALVAMFRGTAFRKEESIAALLAAPRGRDEGRSRRRDAPRPAPSTRRPRGRPVRT